LEQNDLCLPDHYIIQPRGDKLDFAAGEAACEALILATQGEPPTAIISYNDELAIGATSFLTKRGWVIPNQMSIVGNDDIPVARYCNPPLSTIHVDRAEWARRAIDIVKARTAGRDPAPYHVLEAKLMRRSSTLRPGVAAPSRSRRAAAAS
jgi:DNA-binding LacI/PurR family transcriptional regulator